MAGTAAVAREYRNRRIGDFLKEPHLTEGRGREFPTIYDAMESNGSEMPVFDTDDASYVLVTLPAKVISNRAGNGAKYLLFNTLEEVVDFGNGAGNRVQQAKEIVAMEIHSKKWAFPSIGNKKNFGRNKLKNRFLMRRYALYPAGPIFLENSNSPANVSSPFTIISSSANTYPPNSSREYKSIK